MKSKTVSLAGKVKCYDDIFKSTAPGTQNSGELVLIDIEKLLPFPDHPFKLYTGSRLDELVESIKEIGVVNAIIVCNAPGHAGYYQILSGHNRVNAAKIAGLEQIKSEIINVDDDTAALIVVDSNFKQRETLLPSERAFGFKMQLDSLKHQGKRTDLFEDENQGEKARDIIGKKNDLSGFQISNYIRLTYLIPELLDKVDSSHIPLKVGVILSYIDKEKQLFLDKLMLENRYKVDHEKALKLKALFCNEAITSESVKEVFEGKSHKKNIPVKLKRKDLHRFFPIEMDTEDMIKRIYELLEKYSHELRA